MPTDPGDHDGPSGVQQFQRSPGHHFGNELVGRLPVVCDQGAAADLSAQGSKGSLVLRSSSLQS